MSVGVVLSVLLHGGLVAAVILGRPGPPPPSPPMFRVNLVAAPIAPPAAGLVQPTAAPAPVKPVAPPIPKKSPEKKLVPPVKKAPTATAPSSAATPAPTKSEPAPPAGSSSGGRGTDAGNLMTPGIEFPYPYYINNIANVLIRQFNAIHSGRGAFRGMVRFTIRRDGSVSLESIGYVTRSGNFTFDQDMLAAVEAAANAKAFGPLPPGFQEDILPVQFRFEPAAIR